jgi:hypothetical protein
MALLLATGSLGNIRTQTLKAFSADEMKSILAKMSLGRTSARVQQRTKAPVRAFLLIEVFPDPALPSGNRALFS